MVDTSKIRIREHFGLLSNLTSTKQISFLISPPKNRQSPQQHDVVVLDHPVYGESCQIIAKISQISSHEEIAGSSLSSKLGGMSATAEILGYINLEKEDKPMQRLLTPPTPGSRIHVPYIDFIQDALSRDRQGKPFEQPLFLGSSETSTLTMEGENKQINIYLNNKDLTSMHTLMAGVEGTGKTCTIKIIIEEVTKNSTQPIVVIDPNGEYKNLATNYQVTTITAQTKTAPKIAEKQAIILDGQNLTLPEKTVFFNNQITALIKARIDKKVPSFLLTIEDPENLSAEVLKEVVGAKHGISAVLATSHPTGLDAAILTKMGNQIVGKTVDPTDTAVLKGLLNCSEQELVSLFKGEFFVNGLNRATPTKVQVKTVQA